MTLWLPPSAQEQLDKARKPEYLQTTPGTLIEIDEHADVYATPPGGQRTFLGHDDSWEH